MGDKLPISILPYTTVSLAWSASFLWALLGVGGSFALCPFHLSLKQGDTFFSLLCFFVLRSSFRASECVDKALLLCLVAATLPLSFVCGCRLILRGAISSLNDAFLAECEKTGAFCPWFIRPDLSGLKRQTASIQIQRLVGQTQR